MSKLYDLEFKELPSGAIRLTQDAYGDDSSIDLAPSQLRHVAEHFGLVAPNYPADELSKQLAEQLCTVYLELADECHRSHWLELTFEKLAAYVSCIPESAFPHHLWDQREAREQAPAASKPTAPIAAQAQPNKNAPQRQETAALPEAGQLSITLE